jgi:hypothetical protein
MGAELAILGPVRITAIANNPTRTYNVSAMWSLPSVWAGNTRLECQKRNREAVRTLTSGFGGRFFHRRVEIGYTWPTQRF